MQRKVSADEFMDAVLGELAGYSDDIREGMFTVVKDAAGFCVKRLKQTSPKRTGAYSKGWARKLGVKTKQPYARVYNRDRPWLTHLLEEGHEKQNGGFVAGSHHIAAAEKEVEKKMVDDTVHMIDELR